MSNSHRRWPRTVALTQNVWTQGAESNQARTSLEVDNEDASNTFRFLNAPYPWALSFDGTNDEVAITDALTATLLAAENGYGEFLVYRDTGGANDDTIWSVGDTSADEYLRLYVDNANKVGAELRTAAAVQWAMLSDQAIPTGQWVLIRLWSGSRGQNEAQVPVIYVDGDPVKATFTTSTDKTAWIADLSNLDNMFLGCTNVNGAGKADFWLGDMCEAKIYAGTGKGVRLVRSLVALYQFKTGTGTTLVDDSGNGDDGTITSASWVNRSPGILLGTESGRILLPDQNCRETLWLLTAAAGHNATVSEGIYANPVRNRRN